MSEPELKGHRRKSFSEFVKGTFGSEKDEELNCFGNVKFLPIDFLTNTSLHGLKYIGQKNRHLTERFFWIIAWLISFLCSLWLITSLLDKYFQSPVIISFQSSGTSIDNLPFPALTVCNINKVLRSKALKVIKEAALASSLKANSSESVLRKVEALRNLHYMNHVCSASKSFSRRFHEPHKTKGGISSDSEEEELLEKFWWTMDGVSERRNDTGNGFGEFLDSASQSCEEMIPLCVWQDEITPCTRLFKPIETEFGKCCTFNMVPQTLLHRYKKIDPRDSPKEVQEWEKWDFENHGVFLKGQLNWQRLSFPRRQTRAGIRYGLKFLLNPQVHEYFCTRYDSIGFRLHSHYAIDIPSQIDFGSAIRPNSENFISLTPKVTVAHLEDLKDIDIEKRQCYFPHEFQLKFYKYYSMGNCFDECLTNATLEKCGCVTFFMPRDSETPLCTPREFACYEDIMGKFSLERACKKCKPSCNEIKYTQDLSDTPLQSNLWASSVKGSEKWKDENVTIVHVYFETDQVYPMVRQRLYTMVDLLSNCGGIMGLCLGFSALSVMEIIYFITLRTWYKRKHIAQLGSRIMNSIHLPKYEGNQSKSKGPKAKDRPVDPSIILRPSDLADIRTRGVNY